MSKIRRYRKSSKRVKRGTSIDEMLGYMEQLGLSPQLHRKQQQLVDEGAYNPDTAEGNVTFQVPLPHGGYASCVVDVPVDRHGKVKGNPYFQFDLVVDKRTSKGIMNAITSAINHQPTMEVISLPAGLTVSEVSEIAQGLGARVVNTQGITERRTNNRTGVQETQTTSAMTTVKEKAGAKATLKISDKPIVATFDSPIEGRQIRKETQPVLEIRRNRDGTVSLVVPEEVKRQQETAVKNVRRLATGLVAVKAQSTKAEEGSLIEPTVYVDRGLVQAVDVEWTRPEVKELVPVKRNNALTQKVGAAPGGFGKMPKAMALPTPTTEALPQVPKPELEQEEAVIINERTNDLLDPSRLRINSHDYARQLTTMAKEEHVKAFAV